MHRNKVYPQWFLILPFLIYVIFFVGPSLAGVAYSFTDWNSRSGVNGLKFIGLDNYIEIFTSNKGYSKGIFNTLRFTLISNFIKIPFAFVLALILYQNIRGKSVYRTILYLPAIIPFVVVGLIFRSILSYNNGLLNMVLEFLHLGFLKQKWLSDLNVVWGSIYGVDAWRGVGYVMTIFIAGLSAIPRSYYEAADIDGANIFHKLQHITLPMLSGAITINLVFGITYGLKVFDIIYVITRGGPGQYTEVLTTYAFKLYTKGLYGMAAALNAILLLITAIAGILIVWRMSKREIQH